jgi:hypothetical protein
MADAGEAHRYLAAVAMGKASPLKTYRLT